jgi:hypothetical protein
MGASPISVGRSLLLLLRAERPFEGWLVEQRKEFQSESEVFPSSSLFAGFYYEGKQWEYLGTGKEGSSAGDMDHVSSYRGVG